MQLYFHDVGLKGSNTDFPKTIYGDISIDEIVQHVPDDFKIYIYIRNITY